MYKDETLRKYVRTMRKMINYFMTLPDEEFEKYKVIFADRNTKVPCMNVSTAAMFTCPSCKHCKKECYDIKAALRFPGCSELDSSDQNGTMRARAINTAILLRDRKRYFHEIDMKMRRKKKNLFMRWHQAGDNIDYDYVCNMVDVTRANPKMESTWGYTKGHELWNRYVEEHGGSIAKAIPSNLHIMFSVWKIKKKRPDDTVEFITLPCPNPYGFPTYEVQFDGEDYTPTGFHCPGDCGWCIENKRGCVVGESSWTHIH